MAKGGLGDWHNFGTTSRIYLKLNKLKLCQCQAMDGGSVPRLVAIWCQPRRARRNGARVTGPVQRVP